MKKFVTSIALLTLLGFGCATSQPPSPLSEQVNNPPLAQPENPKPQTTEFTQRVLNQSLVGSWHGAGGVPSGFLDRYSFFDDGRYLYIPSEYSEDPTTGAEYGTWRLEGNKITLNTNAALTITLVDATNVEYKVVPQNNKYVLTLGALEKNAPTEVYPYRRLFGQAYSWKYSDDPLFWCPPNSKYYQENPDRDYKACELLLKVYGSVSK